MGVPEHLRRGEHGLEAMGEVEEHRPSEALVAEAEERFRKTEGEEEGEVADCQLLEEAERDELTVGGVAVEEERPSLEFWEAMVAA